MASTGLKGPYALTESGISSAVSRTSAGAYVLGDTNTENVFTVRYVGRADSDVADRLTDHIGNYQQFKFDYFSSPKAAFEKECAIFHDFGGIKKLDNKIHPDRPDNTGWKCPSCDLFN